MTISDATRTQRVIRWTDQKSKWESKLEKANNPNDTATAKAMIVEADSALGRLGVVEVQVGETNKIITSKRKSPGKEKDKTETLLTTKNDTGSLGI